MNKYAIHFLWRKKNIFFEKKKIEMDLEELVFKTDKIER